MKTTRKVNTAVVGLGTIGAVHAEWYRQIPESNLVAVCDAREDVSKKIAAKYDVKSYTDFHDLVEDENVEALTVAVPNYLHHDVAVAAAKARKHVAVEKPLCMDLKEADDMISEVKKAKVLDMYTENLCFAQSYSVAKDIVDSGGVGKVYMCKAFESDDIVLGSKGEKDAMQSSWYLNPGQSGGGKLMSTGVHPIQYVRYIFDRAKALRVHAEIIDSIGIQKPKRMEDMALVTIRFEGDRVGEIHTGYYMTGGSDDRAEIYGDRGTIFLDLYRRNEIKVHSHVGYGAVGQSMFQPAQGADLGWSFPIPNEKYDLGYYHEQRHFLQSVIEGKRPKVNFDDGRATLEIALAAYKSHETGETVKLPL
ncbi:MAG: Gfo/Idh/MocA family oxidoreductase [Thaumarchaeota archaeon]|nr:Gfo/Idh/MocA family oxidoreductase [Nitrososphaerota archaeon]